MVIDKKYQLWKAASTDSNRVTITHISVGHWPVGPEFFTTPSHGTELYGATGAYLREGEPDVPCSCFECQNAHAKLARAPDSPFNMGDVVRHLNDLGVVIVTDSRRTSVAFPTRDGYIVNKEYNHSLKLCWSEKGVTGDTPAVDMSDVKMWSQESIETIMNRYYGIAVATDGWVLAVVPVQIETPEEIGIFDARVLMLAHRASSRAKNIPIMLKFGKKSNGHEYIGLVNGHLLPRYRDLDKVETSYPKWQDIVPKRRLTAGEGDHGVMTFDAKIFVKLAAALGSAGPGVGHYMRLSFSSAQWASPYMLESVGNIDAHYKPPFGLIMPIHDGNSEDWYKVKPLPSLSSEEE